jgi:DNA-binding MarR family transcriptional regulator
MGGTRKMLFMKIEKEIHQEKFINEYQKLLINLIFTNNWVTAQNRNFFENAGVTVQQFNILRILRGAQESISTLQIRERMLDKMSDTSRIVDRLVLKGLVKKTINKFDKRLVCVSITTKGLALLKKTDPGELELVSIMGNLTEMEAKQMNKLLDKLRGN